MEDQNNLPDVFDMDYSRPFLEPLVPMLLETFWEAHDWTKNLIASNAQAPMILNSSTIAGMTSDAFGHFIFPKITGAGGRWRANGRSWLAYVRDSLLLRFKKFTPDLHAMSIHTLNQDDIAHNRDALFPQRKIPSITLGYTLARITSEVTGVYLACPDGWNKNHWIWPIYQIDSGEGGLFVPVPQTPMDGNGGAELLNVDIKVKQRKAKRG